MPKIQSYNNKLIDIGLNLTHPSLIDRYESIINDAYDVGVNYFILTGSDYSSSVESYNLAKNNKLFFATAGIHPHYADTYNNNDFRIIEELSSKHKVVAVGECGLDFHRNLSSKINQINCLQAHLVLANEINKPLFLHQRDAHMELYENLIDFKVNKGVLHCFTEDKKTMRQYLDLNLYIGITGWLCDPQRGQELREAVKYLPIESLLVETDAPYLLPKDLAIKPKDRINLPQFLPHIVQRIAEIKKIEIESLVAQIYRNTLNCFGLTDDA